MEKIRCHSIEMDHAWNGNPIDVYVKGIKIDKMKRNKGLI
jgi:hypothetical protein